MYLLDETTFCASTASVWQLVGRILWIFLIIIPILVIIFGSIDLGKAVVSSDDKEIKKAAKSLLMRIVAALVLWFVPTIVHACFGLVDRFNNEAGADGKDYMICETCVTRPGSNECKSHIK